MGRRRAAAQSRSCGNTNQIQWLRFAAAAQFGEHGVIHAVLRVDKALQVERICILGWPRFAHSHIVSKFCKLVFAIQ